MNKLLLLLWLCISISGKAQPKYQAELTFAPDKGFYIIHLPLFVQSYARTDLTDLRIINSQGKQMPYLIKKDIKIYNRNEFIPYPILSKTLDKYNSRYLITTQRDTLSSLVLKIQNADACKRANLMGSNDTVNWFTVKEQLTLSENFNLHQPSTLQTVNFPVSNYAYYLLTINDSLSAPLNITAIGKIDSEHQISYHLTDVPNRMQMVHQKDTTIITLDYDVPYPICRLHLSISSPEFFRRNISISTPNGLVKTAIFTSEQNGNLYLPYPNKTSKLTLHIFNGDNPELCVDSVNSFTEHLFLIIYLPEAGNYRLTYADPKANVPNYDLTFFENKIPTNLKELQLTEPQLLSTTSLEKQNFFLLFLKKYGIWILIVAISIQILLYVRKMLKE